MLKGLKKLAGRLGRNTSGNVTLLMAVGMPALIGGSGFAVDTAQWYMWKRELQFAVDQAAIAAAWTRTSSDTTVQATYQTRAEQEYNTNISKTGGFDSFNKTTDVVLDGNAVVVTASASKALPFSSFLTDRATTVSVRAKATFTTGVTYSACMLAVHPHADSAFKLGGSVTGSSTCGSGSLSDDANAAMKEAGNTSVPLGTLVATGGIDDGFKNNGTIYENQGGLSDPYATLATPTVTGSAQTYSCPTYRAPTSSITASGYTITRKYYQYYTGNNANNLSSPLGSYNGTGYIADYTVTPNTTFSAKVVTNTTQTGLQAETSKVFGGATQIASVSGTKYWRAEATTTQDFYDTPLQFTGDPGSDGIARPQPGVYSSISITCQTIFAPGIYFISGTLDFGQNQTVTGNGVLFVFTSSSAHSTINSNSVIDISGITKTQLEDDYGYSASYAEKMASMLFWDKQSTSDFTMNGNSAVKLDGTFYMPYRDAKFNGNSTQSGKCIMIAAQTITFLGNDRLDNFCKPNGAGAMVIGGGTATVKLVE